MRVAISSEKSGMKLQTSFIHFVAYEQAIHGPLIAVVAHSIEENRLSLYTGVKSRVPSFS